MTSSRERGDHQPDYGTADAAESYKARRAEELERLRKEDDAKAKQERANQTGRELLKRLNIDPEVLEEKDDKPPGKKKLRQEKMF